eukprot:CAMPEP_0202360468 /NCGR_PEP_ID=MMETSP1126-20121109/13397_1 /ASSEMBLY_ACC=CAM_ASM_000457 /TAXON_ID=3047 /ORGANISM="Dunaliella tertiolecta, Strain CCMP1320" /LENGTH=138 /DNA_ID=CAMNT_0048954183 /DNA_START=1289 /DNA_END=1705 /DNA_ORIENTATION=+
MYGLRQEADTAPVRALNATPSHVRLPICSCTHSGRGAEEVTLWTVPACSARPCTRVSASSSVDVDAVLGALAAVKAPAGPVAKTCAPNAAVEDASATAVAGSPALWLAPRPHTPAVVAARTSTSPAVFALLLGRDTRL